MPDVSSVLDEVRGFLRGLRLELPELFPPPAPSHDRESARRRIEERVAYWSARMEIAFKRVYIKDQRTLWGSCSAEGNLNFNWRLVFAPEPVLDYVVVHELAHRREMNHSKRFWAIVAAHSPEYREHRRWLDQNARSLRRRRERRPSIQVV